ncbi:MULTISPECIES: suppressor of fused domain protein [unclassified Streptomyces]|uniref:suppressor of fused domain protein n=1 Tax=unclassified Streptomyces TaxID=2593676 RepID=UPI002DD8E538|nr:MULTISPECIES: suppressor of fused domain protein [unclassified Streptomyces]WSB76884.1 suppressor of fused domain protein [Streptomyces sp. NBC_01775]WSS14843.1 suppressor of fused domain protein [Streptomyces sp. NBC_01186]WSS43677.1 suppressor of fused domain protein [Streptomyces sp. NBC_01187]
MADVRTLVDSRLRETLGEPGARASVTFLGTERIEVLRFVDADAGTVRYATLGMSSAPMADPAEVLADPERGPRAELLLTVRAGIADTDKVLRPLAVLAASPQVEGVVVAPGASLDTGEPLWPGAPFTSVLVAEPGGLVADLALGASPGGAGGAPPEPVRFLPLLPMTPTEAAWKRVHGADALQERWLRHGTDLRDPARGPVPLGD